MAQVQKYFEQFHETIRIDFDTAEPLREKRDIILKRLRAYLKKKGLPGFEEQLQGSYKMGTGVKPIKNLEYDIDVGLRFNVNSDDYSEKAVRNWVLEAISGHTEAINNKKPCVRVVYADGFHVDLVIYGWSEQPSGVRELRLAHRDNGWRPADPTNLQKYVDITKSRFKGVEDSATKTDQFRRIVRYLKRWEDEGMDANSPRKLTGLAFVLLSAEILTRRSNQDGSPEDALAIEEMARNLGNQSGRINAKKLTPEYEDMCGHLSDEAMRDLKQRFAKLAETLRLAKEEPDPIAACLSLRREFGEDFPVPQPEDTGKKTKAPAIITSSSSALRDV